MSEQLDLLARAQSVRGALSLDAWVDRQASERAVRKDDQPPGRRTPRARKDDVESSHRTADQAEKSGAIAEQLRVALAAVLARPGSTSKELARLTRPPVGMDERDWRYALGRRACELADRDLIIRTLKRGAGDDMRLWPAGYAIPGDAGDRIHDRRRKRAS